MKQPMICPACNATNKPRSVTCRVCGERLALRRETSIAKEPVVLQRVMSGEMFPAVVVPGTEGVRVKEKPRSALDGSEGPTERRAAAPRPGGPMPMSDARVALLLREILAMTRRGDFAHAVEAANGILVERENDPMVLILKADALFRAGRRKEAAEIFDVLIDVDPENAKLWLDRGRIMKGMENYPEALRSYDTALAIDDKIADAWYERATVLDSLANAVEALKSVERTLQIKPDHGPALSLRVDLEKRRATDAVRAVANEIDRELKEIEERALARVADSDALDVETSSTEVPPHPGKTAEDAVPSESPAGEPTSARARPANRLYTYVEGLDEALNGGIPEGHVVIVAGPPGTLKSSLSLSIAAYNAAKERRPTLYITLEESRESLSLQARSLGLPIEDAAGLLTVLDARDFRASTSSTGDDWVDAFAAVLAAMKSEHPFDLLVLDALEAVEAIAHFTDRRRAIFRLFEHLRALSVTTLVVAERPDIVVHGNVMYGRWSEDFLADGILHLRQHLVSDVEVQRRIRIVKMRGTRHETGYMALLVDDGRLRATRAMAP